MGRLGFLPFEAPPAATLNFRVRPLVLSIPQGSVERNKPVDKNEKQKGSADPMSEPAIQELVYTAPLSLD